MRGKKYLGIPLMLMLLTSMAMVSVPVQASPTVRFYAQPVTYGEDAGTTVKVDVMIESPPGWDNTSVGIVGWRLYVKVNPAVLEPVKIEGKKAGYFLYDFTETYEYYANRPKLLYNVDKVGGRFWDVSEFLFGFETLGVGAGGSGRLCTLVFKSKSKIDYSLIDLYNAKYDLIDVPPIDVDIVEDGHYNPKHLDYIGSLLPPGNPTGTQWHELHPIYSLNYNLTKWTDNTDGELSPGDQIVLKNATEEFWYDLVEVTVTIYATPEANATTTNSPSSTSTPDATGWNNPTGAYADGSGSAYITSAKPSDSQYYGGYGFSIPTVATILGVEVRLDAWSPPADSEEIHLNVSDNGGTGWLGSHWSTQLPKNVPETTYWVDVTGWTSWTPAQINNDNIWTQVWAETVGGAGEVRLDWIPVRVNYTTHPMYIDFEGNIQDFNWTNPKSTQWHEIHPAYSNKYNLTSWTDNDSTLNLTVTDDIQLKDKATGVVVPYHVEEVSTDILVGKIHPPPPIPEFPLGTVLPIALIIVIAYVWWINKRKRIKKQKKPTTPIISHSTRSHLGLVSVASIFQLST